MGKEIPNHLFVNVVQPNNATAAIGVKFGGCGNNLISTAIMTNPITMYSLLFIMKNLDTVYDLILIYSKIPLES